MRDEESHKVLAIGVGPGHGGWSCEAGRMRDKSLYGTVAVVDDIGRPRDADGSVGLWPGQKRSENAPVTRSSRS